jgi:DNA-binding response OmpR family regulator
MTRPLTGATVLLIESDPALRYEHGLALARAGARVRSSARADDARRLAAHDDVDAVVWDLDVAPAEAVVAIRELRDQSARKSRSFVALALGHVLADWDPRGRGAFDGYAPLPITPEQLVARVCALLGRREGRASPTTRRLPRVG